MRQLTYCKVVVVRKSLSSLSRASLIHKGSMICKWGNRCLTSCITSISLVTINETITVPSSKYSSTFSHVFLLDFMFIVLSLLDILQNYIKWTIQSSKFIEIFSWWHNNPRLKSSVPRARLLEQTDALGNGAFTPACVLPISTPLFLGNRNLTVNRVL